MSIKLITIDPQKQPGHYCLIVNEPREVMIEGVNFWVYPADDPKAGKIEIYVLKEGENIDVHPFEFQYKHMNKTNIKEFERYNGLQDHEYYEPDLRGENWSIKRIRKYFIETRMIADQQAFGVKPSEEDIK